MFLVRYNGRFYEIKPRPYEPERMTTDIAWIQIKEGVSPEEAYRIWFARQLNLTKLLTQ